MQFPSPPPYVSQRSATMADNMVVASQPLAGQAGLSMLAQGGNAVDAAITAAITLTQVEPTGNGLGSDAFAIVWDGKQLHGLNASGRSPQSWKPDRFAATGSIPDRGWETVTVPGAVAGWVELHKKLGKLPFQKLFEPAISYAQEGFIVSPIIGKMWGIAATVLKDQPGFAEHFLPQGKAPKAGERFVNKAAAATLTSIAETRGESFYRGHLAEQIAAHAAKHSAALSVADMAANTPDWCGTVSQQFDKFSLHEIPPNGQGIAACMALGMLSHTHIRDFGPDDPQALHLMFEAMKLAFMDSAAYVADPAYMHKVAAEHLLDPDYLAERARLIDPNKAQNFHSGSPKQGGTVCLSAADSNGMMVSFIQSNYDGFGSGVVVPGTGIHLQNRGCGFTLEEGHPNQLGGGKRPFHTIIPGFLMAGHDPLMAFGVMGGMMQAQGHVQMALRTQLWGQDVQTAADAPRWRVTDELGVSCEESMNPATLQTLSELGHDIVVTKPDLAFGFGGAQLIQRLDSGGYAGGSDPRKDGGSYGF
ncbi:gamma-glutamyltransferase family protein [Granulosicoccus antarcticus]|uniref:Gamma-glutamyltransferase YwrD n=1 Tax=Granulosicoccus antarcticus IMCC3135 TaxID=1192854 RepID=A0A2Z2P0M5_9GAMM|nr:gamma-glutamyltransferase family protein [Granulosicoccus antarcticus]ASJ73777.1 Putative gamma-glutamyltransferase YwrD [Granulosicoccus antarcticus IMCC3135]